MSARPARLGGPYQGARIRRIEDPPLLTGGATFVDDLAPAGLWHVAVVRSAHAHARVRRVTAPPSVRLVTARDLDPAPSLPGEWEGAAMAAHPLLAGGEVCYVGQPVAAVVAPTLAEAVDAAQMVDVEYEPLSAVVDAEQALRSDAVVLHAEHGTNVAYRESWRRGRVDRAFAAAEVIISQRIVHQRLAAVPLEARAVLAAPPQADAPLTVWASTQMPHDLRDALRDGLRLEAARVIAPHVGGGFGAKINIYPEELLIPLLALRLRRPLKWVGTRREDLLATSHGRSQFADVRLAASRDGRIGALELRVVADVGAYLLQTTAEVPTLTLQMASGPYAIPAVAAEVVEVYTNTVPTGAYRGAGRPEATYYLERAMDLLAAELAMDPAEVRGRNFIPPDAFPYRAPSGVLYDSGNYEAALDRAIEASGYAGWRQQQRAGREQGRYLGIGISSYVEKCAFGADAARVTLNGAGEVTVYTGTSPHGQGAGTGLAQLAADILSVDIASVRVIHGDTALIPEGEGTAGSRTMVVGGSAVSRAAEALRRKVLRDAARLLEARIEDLTIEIGRVSVSGVPHRGMSLGDVVTSRRNRAILSAGGRFTIRGATFPSGTHVAVVEVDTETGDVRLLQHVAVDDCGAVINPLLVDGQIQGGVAQAIGQALYEEVRYDDTGQLLTGLLIDYALPRATAVPDVQMLRMETPSPRNPLGAKGVGEAGTIGGTPAVANAVIDALAPFGIRHLDMPLTPGRIWAALQRATGN